jgi:single-strand DNA-binding protein
MANLNKVFLIGRLTRDPETRSFPSGGKVASFGFAVNNRKRNPQTGQWEDDPCFIDVKAFNREAGRQLADQIEGNLRKGQQVFLEGHLVFETWIDKKDGSKRSVLKLALDNFQYLEPRQDGGGEGSRYARPAAPAPTPALVRREASPPISDSYDEPGPEPLDAPDDLGENRDIPF